MNPNIEFYPVSHSHCLLLCLLQTCSLQTQCGTRVFFWDAYGHFKYGTVERTRRLADVCSHLCFHVIFRKTALRDNVQGTQVVDIKLDDNKASISLL